MQSAEDKVASFSSTYGQLNGFQISHFPHENDVWIFSQCSPQSVGKTTSILVDLTLVD